MGTIVLNQVRKSFGGHEVIKGADIRIEDGQFAVFVGPSGCGKSTLLRMIAGLEDISGGEFLLDGKVMNDVSPEQRNIAMVFQSYALYPHMTVAENIGFSLDLKKTPKAEIKRRVGEIAERLQLTPYLNRKPSALSGGQRQRVAIGRAIIKEPSVILFDEPLSNLDAALRVQMRAELQELHRSTGATIIYVTHDQVEAMTLADQIVVLKDGQVMQTNDPIGLYKKPENTFVAQFIGSPKMNLFPAKVESVAGDVVRIRTDAGWPIDLPAIGGIQAGPVQLGIRPESLTLAEPHEPAEIETRTVLSERLGMETYISFETGGEPGIARVPGDHSLPSGTPIRLAVDPSACHIFDNEGRAIRSQTA
ncbi:ABC transporter ATP-binding protein [Marivivens aquimaris]|uniref:ABC transporter ATP-binding protein n=1 Tax=Marivivens aquimaris TaxID=2774876 RepID=UPI00187F3B56|nr:ABC transporter ATP-binding protein [Marivivens aquimaris]